LRATVFDSYAVLALLFNEPGKDIVKQLLDEASQGNREIFITTVNWAEAGYRITRENGVADWHASRQALLELPIQIVPADLALAELAAEYKAGNKMSLADAFAAALAKQRKAELVTGDPEFKSVESDLKKITWLK
jgi:predicted nucleic acid-binding protein